MKLKWFTIGYIAGVTIAGFTYMTQEALGINEAAREIRRNRNYNGLFAAQTKEVNVP